VLNPGAGLVHPISQPDGMDWEDVQIPRTSPSKTVKTMPALLGAPMANVQYADDDDETDDKEEFINEKEDETESTETKDTHKHDDEDEDETTKTDALLFADNPTGTVDEIQYPLPTNTVFMPPSRLPPLP
jgi:hypothetical protein